MTTERLVPGDKFPELVLCDTEQPLNLLAADGQYTLLSFWASYDAASREKNAALSHLAQQSGRVKMVSVSFDRYASIYRASMKQDGLSEADCHHEAAGSDSEPFRYFRLEQGFRNYLLDGEGRVVALNVSPKDLVSYLR